MNTTRRILMIAMLALPSLAGNNVQAQPSATYPDQSIKIIIPTAAGGTGDILARQVAEILGQVFGQAAVPQNRPGANGIIATQFVVRSPPDGYTLLAASASNIAIDPALYKMPFDVEKDLAPVIEVAKTTQVLIANPKFAATTVPELIKMAKAKPDTIDYVVAGVGSTPHLNMALLASMAGIKLRGIVYNGSTPGRVAVLANEVPIMIDGLAPSLPLIKGGQLRAIAVTSTVRVAALPDVPTVAQTLPGYVGEIWYGVLAPKGTPKPIIDKLNKAIAAGLNKPEIKAKLAAQGADVVAAPAADFAAFIKTEIVKWHKVVQISGAKVQ